MDTCLKEEINSATEVYGAGGAADVTPIEDLHGIGETSRFHEKKESRRAQGPEKNETGSADADREAGADGGMEDLYEVLQISPFAGGETIHRIYRFLAARFHPDNPKTGNAEMFHKVKTAYDVLSNTERRAKYDAMRSGEIRAVNPLSKSIDFMDDFEGEVNRRLALLAVLYSRRRTSPRYPEVSLMEIETFMGFPRDYLDFTTWYLVKKGFVTQADNADYTLTVAGVDYVESQRANLPILNRLLTAGQIRSTVHPSDRRLNGVDRRMNLPDLRQIKTERRVNKKDRRTNPADARDIKLNLYDLN